MEAIKNEELVRLFKYLKKLVKNPVKEIQVLPDIGIRTLLIFQFILCLISVVVSNLFAPYAINWVQLAVVVVASFLGLTMASLFFYYFFIVLYNKELSFKRIFSLVLFSHIPFAFFHLGAHIFPPVDLIGMGIACLLMIVGIVENFQVPKKLAYRLMFSLYSVFFAFWMFNTINRAEYMQMSTPQNLDTIEREVQSDL